MNLFLASEKVSDYQAEVLAGIVGKEITDTTITLIENAADVAKETPEWVLDNREMLRALGFGVELLDLRKYYDKQEELKDRLEDSDVVWFGGGNTFYLRWLLRDMGADDVVTGLVEQDKVVYAGGSAGSVVAGPTLKYIDAADKPEEALLATDEFEVIWKGLDLIDSVIVPHTDAEGYADIMAGIIKKLTDDHIKVVPLKDNEVYIFDGAEGKTLGPEAAAGGR